METPVKKNLHEIVRRHFSDFGLPDVPFQTLRDTLTIQFESLSNDFPVHYLIHELQKELRGSDNYVTGIESEINMRTFFVITDEEEPLKIVFNFQRSEQDIGREIVLFVKKNITDESLFINTIESLPFPVTVILTPSERERVFGKLLHEHDLSFGVLITPAITEELYKLSEEYTPLRIRQTTNRLAIDFEKSNNFLIETAAVKYRSATYDQIRKRIIAANKPVFLADTLINLTSYDESEIRERILKIVVSLKPSRQEIILFPFENLNLVSSLIPTLSKRSIRIAELRR
ncbi:MAG: hypothetical protein HUU54_00155 [Ignavibacteriaceae bacterium]|nr:hypothetical protein [Ignavibacteriaceae bacterium]